MPLRRTHRLLVKASFDRPVTQGEALRFARDNLGGEIHLAGSGEKGAPTVMRIRTTASLESKAKGVPRLATPLARIRKPTE